MPKRPRPPGCARIPFPAAAIVALAAGVTGCGTEARNSGPGTSFEVVDSAGIERVRNGPVGARGDSLIPIRETLRIGAQDGAEELQLYRVRDIVADPGDTLYVLLQRAQEVRAFAPDGTYLRTIGRPGDGPGEMAGVTNLLFAGDTLVANDVQLYRTTLFTLTGEVLDSWPARKGMKWIFPRARVAQGWLVNPEDPFSARDRFVPGTVEDRSYPIALVESIPAALDATGEEPGWPSEVRVIAEVSAGRMHYMTLPGRDVTVGRTPLWEPRSWYGFDERGRLYLADGTSYRIDVIDPGGRLVRRITRVHDPVPITSALIDRFLSEVRAHYDTVEVATEFGTDPMEGPERQAEITTHPYLPALGGIAVGRDGTFLVERPDLTPDPVALEWTRLGPQPEHWDLFDGEGRFQGTIRLPPGFTPHLMGNGWVVGLERDDLGVEYVVRYVF